MKMIASWQKKIKGVSYPLSLHMIIVSNRYSEEYMYNMITCGQS